jgi:O-antigen ligase
MIHLLPLAFVVPALVVNFRQVRVLFSLLGLCSVVVLAAVRFFGDATYGRLSLESSGVIGNPNDLAAHLVWLLPFLVFVLMDRNRASILRLLTVPVMMYAIYVTASTGSRGALVALAAATTFFFMKAKMTAKLGVIVAALLAITLAPYLLPDSVKNRLNSVFGDAHAEAEASKDAREYLFRKSLEFTARHPVFGVGPGQFATYEGKDSIAQGEIGSWHGTHCTWTEVSSESGIPALLFLLGALWYTAFPSLRLYRSARLAGNSNVANACIAFLLAFIGYFTAATFLSHSFSATIPFMIGIGVALKSAGTRELNTPEVNTGPARAVQVFRRSVISQRSSDS